MKNEELKKKVPSHAFDTQLKHDNMSRQFLTEEEETHFNSMTSEEREYWKDMNYITNKYGFRTETFTEEECRESITFLGCSNTYGVGNYKEKTWPSLLSNEMNLKEINLAVPGGSLDAAFRVYNSWQPILKSKITCLLLPPGARGELLKDKSTMDVSENRNPSDHWQTIGPWSFDDTAQKFLNGVSDTMLIGFLSETMQEVRHDRNIKAIKYVAQETDSTLYIVDSQEKFSLKDYTKGRDGRHPGEEWQRDVANLFIEAMK